ncbi:PREDICTED: uncharacterized protein LOC108781032 [Cyphomyrmex costatus]|uniref:uncharacterized protein LOC108781032 n=1 Tax=Cyphomyrmex costatus TaxID=456900 RepID=UPI0008522AB7|nr:PREDICTED: uncharacterized protein LOC108781032 [Cyphomyrmex costatus]
MSDWRQSAQTSGVHTTPAGLRVKKLLCAQATQLFSEEDPDPQENVGDLILDAFKSNPNFIGQVNAETGEQLTFQQMRKNSVKCALWLKGKGIKKGDVVAICTRNSSAVYAPFLASIYIGAIVNPWEEKYFANNVRVMYFLVKNEPDLIFIDYDHFIELLLAITILKHIKKVIKVVTIGKVESSIFTFNNLETILNDDFDKTEIDMFSCEKNDIRDIAIRTFCSSATDYSKDSVEIPYISFVSPSNKQTPVMSPGKIGLWYGSLCWTHGSLLTVHAILSHVTAIKSVVQTMENFVKVINKYKESNKKVDVLCGEEELLHNVNIGNTILSAFKSKPEFIGQIDAVTEEQTTYQQMRENSVKCALWLQQLQCKNTIITICTRHKTLEYIPFLASLYVGATVNTWNEKYMDDRIRIMYFLTEYVPSIIFIDSENYNQFKSVINFVNFDKRTIKPPKIITFGKIKGVDSLESILNDVYDKIKIDEFSCVKMRPMDTVAITFSPSATSYPDSKVYLRCFAFIYPSNQEVPVMNSGDIGLWYGSLNWSYSVILTVRSIISYVTVVKCPQFSDENLYETIEKYKVSDIESKEIVRSNKSGTIWFKFIYKWCSPQTCKMQNCCNYKAKKDTIGKNTYTYYNNKWCCTGDYGYYEKDGEIYIIDKIKDLIKYRIYYLSSTKIENTLLQHPAVSEVVVRSVPHRINGQHPVAYVKTKFETEVTEVELIQFVANNLPDIYKLRGGVHFKRRMPYLPNGKIDRMLVASI